MGEAIAQAIAKNGSETTVPAPQASVGVAVFPEDGKSFEALLHCADERLLRVKWKGGRPPLRGDDSSLRLI